MRLTTTSPGSGKLGGVVASTGRAGTRLAARTQKRQPRSPSQTNSRAITGALAAAWRSLTPAQQKAWNTAAVSPASGFNTFVKCNRNLATIGATSPYPLPSPTPTFPALTPFTATPVYSSPTPPADLSGWLLTFNPELNTGSTIVLRASAAVSAGRGNIRTSELRVIGVFTLSLGETLFINNDWYAVHGDPPPVGQVLFAANCIDPVSGWTSTQVTAAAPFNINAPTPPPGGQILIEINGVPVADVTLDVIQFNSTPVAGG